MVGIRRANVSNDGKKFVYFDGTQVNHSEFFPWLKFNPLQLDPWDGKPSDCACVKKHEETYKLKSISCEHPAKVICTKGKLFR